MEETWPQWYQVEDFAEPGVAELWWRPFDSIAGPKIGEFLVHPKRELAGVFGIGDDWSVSLVQSNGSLSARWRKGRVTVALVREQKIAAAMIVKFKPETDEGAPEFEELDW
jgi:hypothetical protein